MIPKTRRTQFPAVSISIFIPVPSALRCMKLGPKRGNIACGSKWSVSDQIFDLSLGAAYGLIRDPNGSGGQRIQTYQETMVHKEPDSIIQVGFLR